MEGFCALVSHINNVNTMTTYRQAKWFIIYVITQGELVDEKAYQTTEMFLDQRKEFLRFFVSH